MADDQTDDRTWILDQLPVGVWVGRVPDGASVYANRAFQEILGMQPVESSRIGDVPVTYGVFDRLGLPFPVERLPFSQVMASRRPVVVDDMVIHRRDGGKINIRAYGAPVFSGGELGHIVVTFLDNTREVVAEEQRRSIEARLAMAIAHAPIVIASTDRNGVIDVVAGAGLAAAGLRPEDLERRSVFDLYGSHPTVPAALRRALAGEPVAATVELPVATFACWLAPLRDGRGEVVGAAGVAHDISEVRRLQAQAIQNDRAIAMGTLASSVAHEINNPLTYVLGYLRDLETDLVALAQAGEAAGGGLAAAGRALLDRARAHLEPALRGTERIAAITRELRSFTRPDDAAIGSVDLGQVVRAVLHLVGKEVEARARLTVDLGHASAARGNEARLVQVVLNLVVNALQATAGRPIEQTHIAIGTCEAGDRVILEVADNGPGVPEALRQRIFEPFFSTKGVGEGTGLGLFVCRNLVRDMGGDIAVEDRPGGGALFRVALAVARDETQEAPAPAAASLPAEADAGALGARILVVDDDTLVADVLAGTLRGAGYQVEVFHDGSSALTRLVSPEPVDLVFCDLMMRGMTGMQLAANVREQAPASVDRLVFMTGGAFTPEATTFVEQHGARCVDKPFDVAREARRRLAKRG